MKKFVDRVTAAGLEIGQVALLVGLPLGFGQARADVVTDWNAKAADIVVAHRLGPPPANQALAIVQVSVFEAVKPVAPDHGDPQR